MKHIQSLILLILFFISTYRIDNQLYLLIFVILLSSLSYKKMYIDYQFTFILGLLSTIFFLQYITVFALTPLFYVRYLLLFLGILIVQRTMDINTVLAHYMFSVFILSSISIPIYFLQIYDYDLILSIIEKVQSSIPVIRDIKSGNSNTVLFYTIHHKAQFRNCGFAWEPGAFGFFINFYYILAILFKYKLKWFQIVLPFIALLTTFSTTAYIVIPIIIFVAILHLKSSSKRLYLMVIFIALLGSLFPLYIKSDFIGKEIIAKNESASNMIVSLPNANESASFGRFGSLIVAQDVLSKYPLFGIGGEQTLLLGAGRINITNGWVKIFTEFGLIGLAIVAFHFFRFLRKRSNQTTSIALFIALALMNTSHGLILSPIVLLFFYTHSQSRKSVHLG